MITSLFSVPLVLIKYFTNPPILDAIRLLSSSSREMVTAFLGCGATFDLAAMRAMVDPCFS
jgi:hypothetical protein